MVFFFKMAAAAILDFRNFEFLTITSVELYHHAKFRGNRGRDMSVSISYEFGLKMPIHAHLGGFGGTFPPNDVTHRPNPKRTVLGQNQVIRKSRISVARFKLSVGTRIKDRIGQDRKKVTKGSYFTYLWRSPREAMYIQICLVGDVLDVIKCAKFQNEIFGGYDFTRGRIFHFSIVFEWAVGLQPCSATALPVTRRSQHS